ncbi:sortase [Paractinoplanes atraurantiacus]|uniref:LPXTG-site transpeptidase (Sortase) family protein n=1 Tax=Paractinoplanes atraurantiacus TaxID=1036182 RepID=A0A285JQ64_9ACTN|nr:class E sortase [Actinoplanes atraurantiacus]SNY62233.1 LPXTG-site transpeptidase (sortase) family protein [Actinoplanes atraurantiacus]
MLLGLVGQMTVLGELSHARAQKVSYANFRATLAQATAPVSHVADGQPLAPGTAIAVITIPSIDVNEVVFEGTTGEVLKSGPGHRRDTALPGQAGVSVLMGRRAAYGGPFARIGDLQGGDKITVTTGQGENSYEVIGVRRAGELAPPALADGAGRLTLMTADGEAYLPQDVLRVDANLTSQVQETSPLAVSTQLLPEPEQVMEIDPIALVPLVLWGQLLVAAALSVTWLRRRLGRWHGWLIGVPVLGLLGVLVAGECARLLPNLL